MYWLPLSLFLSACYKFMQMCVPFLWKTHNGTGLLQLPSMHDVRIWMSAPSARFFFFGPSNSIIEKL